MTDAAPAGSSNELAVIYPVARVFTIAGRKVEIPAASVRICTEVQQKYAALSAVMALEEANDIIYADEHPDEYADLLFHATKLERDWLLALDAADKLAVYRAWWEVNGDFFVRRVLPAQMALQETIAAAFGLGPTSSSTSEAGATPTPSTTPPRRSKRGPPSSAATSGNVSANVS